MTAVLMGAALLATTSTATAQFLPLGPPPAPPGNPITVAKAQLGKALFWDEQLSSTRSVSCGTCHIPAAGGIDPRTATDPAAATHPGPDGVYGSADDVLGSPGVPASDAVGSRVFDDLFGMRRQVTPRIAGTMINAAYAKFLFWDGRADGSFNDPITGALVLGSGAALESVVAEPFVNEVEMGHAGRDWHDVIARIDAVDPLALSPSVPVALESWISGRAYDQLFEDAFGTPGITAARTCMAVATYMRTLVSDQTPFDLFLEGDPAAMSPLETDGFDVFVGNLCANCHFPPTFTGQDHIQTTFFYTGVRPRDEDLGRFEVTGDPLHRGLMKMPGLRNVRHRARFFHNGGKETLDQVIDFYNAGGDFEVGSNALFFVARTLGADRTALLAFLDGALTDPRVEQGLPPFDHPALSEGTDRVPAKYGAGTAGSAGQVPRIHAIEPTLLGTDDFTVAISGARSGAVAGFFLSLDADVAGTPFLGAQLHIDRTPGTRLWRLSALKGSGAADGWESLTIALPSLPVFAGVSLYGQWVVLDPHGSGLLSATEAIELRLFD